MNNYKMTCAFVRKDAYGLFGKLHYERTYHFLFMTKIKLFLTKVFHFRKNILVRVYVLDDGRYTLLKEYANY